MIVREVDPVSLIGGAKVNNQCLIRVLAMAPKLIAADGGANTAMEYGHIPDAVIGDFDSLTKETRNCLPEASLHHIKEQDSNDFDKCLRNIHAPLIIGIGFSGARADHQLAAFNTLVRHPTKRCILIGEDDLIFLCPPSLRLALPEGSNISLFPMGAVEGISDGLHWPIDGLNFAPDGRVGTSNRALGAVHLSVTAPKMLVILPPDTLETVVSALQATVPCWQVS